MGAASPLVTPPLCLAQRTMRGASRGKNITHTQQTMGKRKGLIGHMVVELNQDTCWTRMILLEVAYGWIHLTGEVVLMGSILFMV